MHACCLPATGSGRVTRCVKSTAWLRAGARIEVRAAPTAAELSVYAGGNPICASLLLTVAQLDQPINCSRRMPARFITVSSTDGTALPVCALDALVDTPPPAPPPDASPNPSTDAAAPAPAADADPAPPQSTSSSSAWRQPRQGGPPGPPPRGEHSGSGAVPWAGGKGSAVASAVNQGPAPPRLSSGADVGAPPPRVRPLAPAEVAVMFGAATSAGSGVGGGDLALGPLRSGLPPRAAAPSGTRSQASADKLRVRGMRPVAVHLLLYMQDRGCLHPLLSSIGSW